MRVRPKRWRQRSGGHRGHDDSCGDDRQSGSHTGYDLEVQRIRLAAIAAIFSSTECSNKRGVNETHPDAQNVSGYEHS